MPGTISQYFPLGGGLDIVTPALSIPPGRLIACINFEPWYNDGYRRIDGFERFDGRPRPHLQDFTGLRVTDATGFALGDTVTGQTSSTTGVVIGIYIDDGTFGYDQLAVTKVSGSGFQDGEDVQSNGTGTAVLVPDANATDANSALINNVFTDIDEGVANADSVVNTTVDDEFPNGGAAQVIWTLEDLPSSASAITEWTIRVRARVRRTGGETDDSVTYQLETTVGAQSQSVTYTQADVGGGFITRAATQSSPTGTPANVDAATVTLEQTVWTQAGAAPDNNKLDVDCFELDVDYTPQTDIIAPPVLRDAPTVDLEDQWLLAAQDDYRADIQVVPGAGEVRGIWRRRADTYAWRNNVGNTAGIAHLASSSGWTTVGLTLAEYIKFDAGTDTPGPIWQEGDTVTGATSGASATIHRLIDWAGSYSGNDATGYLVLTGVTSGPFQNNENLQVGGNTIALANGANTAFSFSIDGTYRFHNHNFFATSGSYRAYGVNGEDDAFEIDENGIISPIIIPTVADLVGVTTNNDPPAGKPYLITEHRNHLFLAFPGGRVVHSVLGQPLNFSAFLNAAEFGLGDEVTGMNSVVGGVLVLTTERETRGLFGENILDWQIKLIGEQTGGRLYSTQTLDTVYALDDLGITSVARTETFGDFVGATISQLIQPIINTLRDLITDSTIVRTSNQFRLYFSDNSALIMFVPQAGAVNESRGTTTAMRVQFGFASYPFPINRIYNIEDESGVERTFFASTDGFAYEDRVGTNFDGGLIRSYIRTAFTHLGSPSFRKKFRRLNLELSASRPLELKVISDLTFGAPEISSSIADITTNDVPVIDIFAGGGFWDDSQWDEFFWDGQNISTARAYLRGTGENVSFLVFNETEIARPFILQGMTVHYDKRRLQR